MIGDVEEGREVVASMTTTLVGETRSFRSFRFDTGNTGYLKKKRKGTAGGGRRRVRAQRRDSVECTDLVTDYGDNQHS